MLNWVVMIGDSGGLGSLRLRDRRAVFMLCVTKVEYS